MTTQPNQGHIKRQLLSLEVFAKDIGATVKHAEYLIMDVIGMRGRFEIDKNNNICAVMPFGNQLETQNHIGQLTRPLLSLERYMCNNYLNNPEDMHTSVINDDFKKMLADIVVIEDLSDDYVENPGSQDISNMIAMAWKVNENFDIDTFIEAKAIGSRLYKMIKQRNKTTRF